MTTSKISDCGAARLLSAIFDIPIEQTLAKVGIIVPTCIDCGERLRGKLWEGRCRLCYLKSRWIEIECNYCLKLFKRRQSEIISHTGKHNQKHFFHNRQCLGHWLAKNYGFGSPRETDKQRKVKGNNLRKHDWNRVWQLHQETGWGSWRLSRALNIPSSTISYILRNYQEVKE